MSNLTAFESWIANGTTFNGTAALDGTGLSGTAGTPLIAGMLGFAIILIIIWKYKPTLDLSIISIITILEILALGLGFPEWIKWLVILVGGGFFGMGLIKLKKGG